MATVAPIRPAQQPTTRAAKPTPFLTGRISRMQLVFGLVYSLSIFFVMAFLIALASATHILPSHPTGIIKGVYTVVYTTLYVMASVFFAVTSTSLVVRRWHDLNMSGWWAITHIIPILDILVLVYLLSAKTKEPNSYGAATSTTSYVVVLGFKLPPQTDMLPKLPNDYEPPADNEPFEN